MQTRDLEQQAQKELQDAREQLDLHSQLLHEQDKEVHQLQQLLEAERNQMHAQQHQQACEVAQLQKHIREQQQQAAASQQATVLIEAEGMAFQSALLLSTY